ncbi:hypothetical protein [Devosia sp. LjRoot3]|uniref:hypothetical protein n=1 Tax=Devosia sp. LjRoot3 TaxID=3342319 RepID=UPI003ECC50C5
MASSSQQHLGGQNNLKGNIFEESYLAQELCRLGVRCRFDEGYRDTSFELSIATPVDDLVIHGTAVRIHVQLRNRARQFWDAALRRKFAEERQNWPDADLRLIISSDYNLHRLRRQAPHSVFVGIHPADGYEVAIFSSPDWLSDIGDLAPNAVDREEQILFVGCMLAGWRAAGRVGPLSEIVRIASRFTFHLRNHAAETETISAALENKLRRGGLDISMDGDRLRYQLNDGRWFYAPWPCGSEDWKLFERAIMSQTDPSTRDILDAIWRRPDVE